MAVSALIAFTLIGFITSVSAQSNIRATKHNLSSTGTGSVKATSETQVCVFCHTPHGANTSAKTPLWNRSGTTTQSSYTRYSSSSLDANVIADGFSAQPGGSSVLCLSCHDGTVALGNVNVLNGKTNQIIALNSGVTTMPVGSGANANTGFTRNLGIDLSNDHPISITYNDKLATDDGEFARLSTGVPAQRDVDTSGTLIGIRSSGYKPVLPLEPTGNNNVGQVQCATCHDPHITKEKFLRLNRFQTAQPTATFSQANDQICLACHRKLGTTWSQSAHANTTSAAYVYKDDASLVRGFPRPSDAGAPPLKQVWQVACLNCHDTHTASGSRRLLREGTGATPSAASAGFQLGAIPQNNPGGSPLLNTLQSVSAIENTCYQCHNTTTASIVTTAAMTATSGVPDIFTAFNTVGNIRMPIKTSEQAGTTKMETHDIRNANMIECRKTMGNPSGAELAGDHLTTAQKAICDSASVVGSNDNRHVECTDCHNPHRVIKNSLFNASGTTTQRTHTAGGTTANLGADGNIASGVLRGTWGVEPGYPATSTAWPDNPTYTVKKGDPLNTSTLKSADHLTREYQLCLKCHSSYANSDAASGFPTLGNTGGGTASGTNGVSRYTNVAAEFAANANDTHTGTDQGETGNDPAFAPAASNGAPTAAPNHRSWHPVIFPTGRTAYERTGNTATSGSTAFSNIRPPFNITDGSNPSNTAKIGKQTMQCSDCHGEYGSWTQGASRNTITNGPNLATVQGPHGSSKNFLLKGVWDITVQINDASGDNSSNAGGATICGRCHDPISGKGGFSNNDAAHSKSDHSGSNSRCMFCHIAVPHGWKNKAFRANLNCLGPEVGKAAGCTNAFGQSNLEVTKQLWAAPYYNGAMLRVASWKSSNAWTQESCGSGINGSGWMSGTCQAASKTQQAQSTGY